MSYNLNFLLDSLWAIYQSTTTFTLAHSNVYFPVVIKQQTTVTDKVKHRLEDLNDFEEVTDLELLHYVAPENVHTPPITGFLV